MELGTQQQGVWSIPGSCGTEAAGSALPSTRTAHTRPMPKSGHAAAGPGQPAACVSAPGTPSILVPSQEKAERGPENTTQELPPGSWVPQASGTVTQALQPSEWLLVRDPWAPSGPGFSVSLPPTLGGGGGGDPRMMASFLGIICSKMHRIAEKKTR